MAEGGFVPTAAEGIGLCSPTFWVSKQTLKLLHERHSVTSLVTPVPQCTFPAEAGRFAPDSTFLEWLQFGDFGKFNTKKDPKLPVSCYSSWRTRTVFLFSEDFCSHLKRSSNEEREDWSSSLSRVETGDLFLLADVCSYTLHAE